MRLVASQVPLAAWLTAPLSGWQSTADLSPDRPPPRANARGQSGACSGQGQSSRKRAEPPSSRPTADAAGPTSPRGQRVCAAGPRRARLQIAFHICAKSLAVSYRRARSFSRAFITIQSRSPRNSCLSFAGSVLRSRRDRRCVSLQRAQPRARLAAAPPRGSCGASRRRPLAKPLAVERRRARQSS